MQTKKISELSPLLNATGTLRIPCIDAQATATATVTAAQVAQLGGGAPGVNTVDTQHIKNGAVTAANVGFTQQDVFISRSANGAGPGAEFPCTAFGRQWLAYQSAQAASAGLTLQLFASPTFTGQVSVPAGSAAAPSIIQTGEPDTGLFFPAADTIGLATSGASRFTIGPTGAFQANLAGSATLYGAYFCRAMMHFNGNPSPPTAYANGNHGFAAVARVQNQAQGVYELTLATAMPDTDYIPLVTCNIPAAVINVLNKTTTGFRIQIREWAWTGSAGVWNYSNTDSINVAIFR